MTSPFIQILLMSPVTFCKFPDYSALFLDFLYFRDCYNVCVRNFIFLALLLTYRNKVESCTQILGPPNSLASFLHRLFRHPFAQSHAFCEQRRFCFTEPLVTSGLTLPSCLADGLLCLLARPTGRAFNISPRTWIAALGFFGG